MRASADNIIWDSLRLSDPHTQPDKARRIRAMFDRIAPTYELVNRVLSAGRDGYWRRRSVELAEIGPSDRVLDVACGTGDFARAFAKAGPRMVIGSDFSEQMTVHAARRGKGTIRYCRGDALALPFGDEVFTVVSCAFGVRNFQSLSQGLREIHRVLVKGGRVVVLEFTMPTSRIVRPLYALYFQHILPLAARLISGDRTGAYDYLPRSVGSFRDAPGMIHELESAGFSMIRDGSMTGGIVTVCLAEKS